MSFVLDSSATLAWVYPDELTPATKRLSEQVSEVGAFVPTIWRLEIGNNLLLAVRRGRIGNAQRANFLEFLNSVNITVDRETEAVAWTSTMRLAERFRLTLYDACYLELAQRRALPLATLDRDLRGAGKKLGLDMLGV